MPTKLALSVTSSSLLQKGLGTLAALSGNFTMHSLKTTLLTWGLQIQVGVEKRAAQGPSPSELFWVHRKVSP